MTYNTRSGAIRWQIPDFQSDGSGNVCSFPKVCLSEQQLEDLSLKILVKLQCTTFAVVTFDGKSQRLEDPHLSTFVLPLFLDVYISNFVTLRMWVKVMMADPPLKSFTGGFFVTHRFSDITYLYISRNCVTLNIQVKITMYNIRYSNIRFLVSTSITRS